MGGLEGRVLWEMFGPEWQEITGATASSPVVTRKRHYNEQKEEDGRYAQRTQGSEICIENFSLKPLREETFWGYLGEVEGLIVLQQRGLQWIRLFQDSDQWRVLSQDSDQWRVLSQDSG